MKAKALSMALAVTGAVALSASALEVQSVTARQRWPWNGLVDVDLQLSGTEAGAEYRVSLSADLPDREEPVALSSLVSEPIVRGDGTHRLVWNADADLPGYRANNVTIRANVETYAAGQPVYLVIDLSGGKDAVVWPHRYTTQEPDLSSDVCRTTELWLKRCPAGTFTMGFLGDGVPVARYYPPHKVKLTKAFYLGVFETTQEQYFRMTGEWPSYFTGEAYRATRPVERVCFKDLFNSWDGWYAGKTINPGALLLTLRAKTGFSTLNLPTEAQWEYACRGGSTGEYYYPEIKESTLRNYGRNSTLVPISGVGPETTPDVGGTAKVGSYQANPWGFYDMYGNVMELCGDGMPYAEPSVLPDWTWFTDDIVDPRGSPEEKYIDYVNARVCRGGAYDCPGWWMPQYRYPQSYSATSASIGIRLCVTCE